MARRVTTSEEAWDTEDCRSSTRCRLVSPLSHCLSLRWFWSHIVVSGVRPQLGQAAVLRVLCVLCVSVAALSRPCTEAEVGARLASRACGLRVPLLAASGGGLVVVVVTEFPHDISKVAVATRFRVATGSSVVTPCSVVIRLSRCPPPSRWCRDGLGGRDSACVASGGSVGPVVPWSRSWVPVCGGTGVCGFPTLWHVHGPGWFCLWALDPVEV
ncbi:hypothetical protein Taro_001263 [Colocasia esculenta]|uniref:Uncharacterized protein n=1 Tax=Colocasia esculenta TaxID=4460 RepID=A0A843TE77_COLES|nr:hypothetical protein [Colocasia esculenta]